MRDLVIVGCGGFGREVADIVDAINDVEPTWRLLGFVDDAPRPSDVDRTIRRGLTVLGPVDALGGKGLEASWVAVAVASPAAREQLVTRPNMQRRHHATLTHPSANVSRTVTCGPGLIVAGHADIGSDVTLGSFVHIDRAVQIGHDSVLNDYATIHPAAVISGSCSLGRAVDFGTGATTLPGIYIGERTVVGASACVTRSLPECSIVKGVPAR